MLGGPVRAVVFDLFDTLVDLRFEDFPKVRGKALPTHRDIAKQDKTLGLSEVRAPRRMAHAHTGLDLSPRFA